MTHQHPPYTRQGDDPALHERLAAARREGRRRTVLMSVIAAGIVSQFFGYVNDRDQIQRSRLNCNLIQKDRQDRAETLERGAYQIIGNPRVDPPIPPFKFKGTAFEPFKNLLIAQAGQDLERSRNIRARIENCKKVFRNPSIIPFT